MKKKILLAEQWGSCDATGHTIGHASKVLNEYAEMIQEEFIVDIMVHENLLVSIKNHIQCKRKRIKYAICEEENKSLKNRMIDKFKLFSNISKIWKQKDYDVIWFFKGDFFLLFYALYHKKVSGTKYYCLLYDNQFGTGIIGRAVDFIYRQGIKKFDGIIYTQKTMEIPHQNTFYMPDYLYRPEDYLPYISETKQEKAVCVGTMNRNKDLEGLVRVFNKIGYPLEIVGKFMDQKQFEYLKEIAMENITIHNCILSEQEYKRKIGEAKYSVIPYKMSSYAGRTSGVLQESIFLRALPIAPTQLLTENRIKGIAYDYLEELILEKKNYCEKEENFYDEDLEEYFYSDKKFRLLYFLSK